ncbi:MAG: hypothetical protein LBI14_06240 [Treponema sp.]|jgi:hypothetical protein|nr:hypothetical protein [Treponema sp.]
MKKLLVVLIILMAAVSLSADPINIGAFPVGKWLDPNYDAVWEFSSNNIRILSTDGTVLYDFSTKTINAFSVFMDGTQPGISFTCPESGRSYRFVKPLTSTDLVMQIVRSGLPNYSVTMRMQ